MSDWMDWIGSNVWAPIQDVLGISDAQVNQAMYWLSGVPVLGDVMDMFVGYDKINDYLENTGQSWADIEYPGMGMAGAVGVSGMLNFVSDNIKDLYNDEVAIYRGDNGRFTRKRS